MAFKRRSTKRRAPARARSFKRGPARSRKRTFSRMAKGRRRVVSRKRKLLPKLTHHEVNRNVVYPRTHQKMMSEIVIQDVFPQTKAFLTPSKLNSYGELVFSMNGTNAPGQFNEATATGGVNLYPLADTTSMPKFMGSTAQAARYQYMLVTGSSIAITVKVKQSEFVRTGATADDAIYTPTQARQVYFALVPYNSYMAATSRRSSLQLMPWAQIIRQPGARRMALSNTGKTRGTLRGYTSLGKIEGKVSWETDVEYRSSSEDGTWSDPQNSPFWIFYAYFPYSEFVAGDPGYEFDIKQCVHATFMTPKAPTLYTATQSDETKTVVSDTEAMLEATEEADDDDPSLLDMHMVHVTEPKEGKVELTPPPAMLKRAKGLAAFMPPAVLKR